jgi:hypothetical protein
MLVELTGLWNEARQVSRPLGRRVPPEGRGAHPRRRRHRQRRGRHQPRRAGGPRARPRGGERPARAGGDAALPAAAQAPSVPRDAVQADRGGRRARHAREVRHRSGARLADRGAARLSLRGRPPPDHRRGAGRAHVPRRGPRPDDLSHQVPGAGGRRGDRQAPARLEVGTARRPRADGGAARHDGEEHLGRAARRGGAAAGDQGERRRDQAVGAEDLAGEAGPALLRGAEDGGAPRPHQGRSRGPAARGGAPAPWPRRWDELRQRRALERVPSAGESGAARRPVARAKRAP